MIKRPENDPENQPDTPEHSERSGIFLAFGKATRWLLEEQRPSILFLIAFIVLVLASLVAQLAIYYAPGTEQVKRITADGMSRMMTEPFGSLRAVAFISACSYFMRVAALMLAVWALIRLLADAIRDGAKS